jgi:hypothetical protein
MSKLVQSEQRISCGLYDRETEVRFPAEGGYFYLLHSIQTGSGAHPASHQVGIGGTFLGAKEVKKYELFHSLACAEVKNVKNLFLHVSLRRVLH